LLFGGRYDLDGIVGRGDMAEVYRARDIRLDRIVAVKTLREELARDNTFQARFRREAQSAASLGNTSIVAVYDTGEDTVGGSHIPYIVMEYVDGRTLRDLLRDDRRLLPERTLEITDGVLRALEYSHRSGIVHRDIKPGNVMLTRNGQVKVMDFGIARAVSADFPLATESGTALYLSPEQARGERVDARSDLYSTGCLLYELLTGRPPFLGDSPVAIAYQHVRENPTLPSRVDPEIPQWGDTIVLRAMAKDPGDRYQSAAEMRVDIQRALRGMPLEGPYGVATTQYPGLAPGVRRRPTPSLRLPDSPPTVVPVSPAIVLKRPTIVRVDEAPTRRSEPLGDETRSFNNARSSSTSIETISVRYEAGMSVMVDLTKTRALSGSAGLRFIDIASAHASLENDLARRFSRQMDEKLTSEQTTTVNIPAHTNVEVIFHWKRIWATGMLTIAEQARRLAEIAEVPFEITIGLAFDKETRDIGARRKKQK
jgi:serine/threonine protein kinase